MPSGNSVRDSLIPLLWAIASPQFFSRPACSGVDEGEEKWGDAIALMTVSNEIKAKNATIDLFGNPTKVCLFCQKWRFYDKMGKFFVVSEQV